MQQVTSDMNKSKRPFVFRLLRFLTGIADVVYDRRQVGVESAKLAVTT